MHNMKSRLVFFLMSFFILLSTEAQCAMCRAVLESEEDQSLAQGVNDGIVFLMAIPYILVLVIGYIVYRKFFKSQKAK